MKVFFKMGNITGRGLYIILTVQLSIQEYGKTGIIIGKISVKNKDIYKMTCLRRIFMRAILFMRIGCINKIITDISKMIGGSELVYQQRENVQTGWSQGSLL